MWNNNNIMLRRISTVTDNLASFITKRHKIKSLPIRSNAGVTIAFLKEGFSPDLRLWTENSAAVRRFRYTSATQRSEHSDL